MLKAFAAQGICCGCANLSVAQLHRSSVSGFSFALFASLGVCLFVCLFCGQWRCMRHHAWCQAFLQISTVVSAGCTNEGPSCAAWHSIAYHEEAIEAEKCCSIFSSACACAWSGFAEAGGGQFEYKLEDCKVQSLIVEGSSPRGGFNFVGIRRLECPSYSSHRCGPR